MDRDGFEGLHALDDKVIRGDIRFSQPRAARPLMVVDGLAIENGSSIDVRLNINYNPETGAKTFNVYVPGAGPICRLDVDGAAHGDAGRCHKHELRSERCPDRNLPDTPAPRNDLSGKPLR